MWFYGAVSLRGPVKIKGDKATQEFSSTTRPLGFDFDAPSGFGTHKEDGDETRVVIVEVKAPDDKTQEPEGLRFRLHEFLATEKGSDEFRLHGAATVHASRSATHKATTKEGDEADEFRWAVTFDVEQSKPLQSQLAGFFANNKRVILAIEEAEPELVERDAPDATRNGRDLLP